MSMEDHDRAVERFQRSAGDPGPKLSLEALGPSLSKKIGENTYELIDPNEVRIKQSDLLVAYLAAAIIEIVMIYMVAPLGAAAVIIGTVVVFIFVLCPLLWQCNLQVGRKWLSRWKEFMHEEIVRLAGRVPDFEYYSHGYRDEVRKTAFLFGIAFSDDKIYIIDRNILRIIPLRDVVRVEIKHQKAIVYEPLLLTSYPSIYAAADNAEQIRRAKAKTERSRLDSLAASGIFIEIDDPAKDYWQFMSSNLPVLEQIYRKLDREFKRLNGELPKS